MIFVLLSFIFLIVGHWVKVKKDLVNTLEDLFWAQSSPNLVRMFVCIRARMCSKLGFVESKGRSLGQILQQHCQHPRDHMFVPIVTKLGQKVNLDEIFDKFKPGLRGFQK